MLDDLHVYIDGQGWVVYTQWTAPTETQIAGHGQRYPGGKVVRFVPADKLATYRNALELYGGHRNACHFWPSNAGDGPANCTCGLHELLGASK